MGAAARRRVLQTGTHPLPSACIPARPACFARLPAAAAMTWRCAAADQLREYTTLACIETAAAATVTGFQFTSCKQRLHAEQ